MNARHWFTALALAVLLLALALGFSSSVQAKGNCQVGSLEDLTITRGLSQWDVGGGIDNYGGTLTLQHSAITNNTPDDIYP